jgi:hypothetical protein
LQIQHQLSNILLSLVAVVVVVLGVLVVALVVLERQLHLPLQQILQLQLLLALVVQQELMQLLEVVKAGILFLVQLHQLAVVAVVLVLCQGKILAHQEVQVVVAVL